MTYGRNVSDMPPLLVRFEKKKFYAMVQKEMFMALKQRKINAYHVLIMIHGNEDYKIFMDNYGKHLLGV